MPIVPVFALPLLAQAAGGTSSAYDLLLTFAPFVVLIPVWYYLVIRPQQQMRETHKQLVANVRRGDTVVTSGGIIGKVIRVVDDNEVQIEIADGVRVRLLRQMITDVRSKGDTTASKDAA